MTKKSCKVYLYKITFEEVPYFYYGIHKEKRDNSKYLGSPIRNKWAWEMYTPKKQILQVFSCWEEALVVEARIISYFLNRDINCLNACAGKAFIYSYGKDNHCYGKKWWNNGSFNIRSDECPGEGWSRGVIHKSKGIKRGPENANYGKKWWNNGKEETLSDTDLTSPWVKGRLKRNKKIKRGPLSESHKEKMSKSLKGLLSGERNPMSRKNYTFTEEHKQKMANSILGRKWWNNGQVNKFQREKPGVDWSPGMLKGNLSDESRKKLSDSNIGRKWWNNGKINKFQTQKPGPDWLPGMLTKKQKQKLK